MGGSEAAELPLDVVYEVLSNECRRRVLRFLLAEPEGTTLGDLAEHLASIENGKPVDALSSAERKRVYICLYQCHLPKMDDAGIVAFEEDRKTVELAEHADAVTEYLPGADDGEPEADDEGWRTTVAEFTRTIGGRLHNGRTP